MVRAEFPGVRVIETGENVGASTLNRAIPGDGYDWLLILDDDCYLEPATSSLPFALPSSTTHSWSRSRCGPQNQTARDSTRPTSPGCFPSSGYAPYIFHLGQRARLDHQAARRGLPAPVPARRHGGAHEARSRSHHQAISPITQPQPSALGLHGGPPAATHRRRPDRSKAGSGGRARCRFQIQLARAVVLDPLGLRVRRRSTPPAAGSPRSVRSGPEQLRVLRQPPRLDASPVERMRGGTKAPIDRPARFRAVRPTFFPAGTATLQR